MTLTNKNISSNTQVLKSINHTAQIVSEYIEKLPDISKISLKEQEFIEFIKNSTKNPIKYHF